MSAVHHLEYDYFATSTQTDLNNNEIGNGRFYDGNYHDSHSNTKPHLIHVHVHVHDFRSFRVQLDDDYKGLHASFA